MMQRVLMSSGMKRMSGIGMSMSKVSSRTPMALMSMRSFADAAELTIDEKPMNHPEDQGVTFQETSLIPHGDAGTFASPINVSLVEGILKFIFYILLCIL